MQAIHFRQCWNAKYTAPANTNRVPAMLKICPNKFIANFRSADETRGPAASDIRTGRNQSRNTASQCLTAQNRQ